MTEVALTELAQPLTSIVARNGPEDNTSAPHHIPAARKTRPRKIRTQEIARKVGGGGGGGGAGRRDKEGSKMSSGKTSQHKDYLSEQRARRLGKKKTKDRGSDQIRKSKETINKEEEEEEEDKEEEEEVVKEEEKSDERTNSAESESSKDEGISSNGEKDEEVEGEEGKSVDKDDDKEEEVDDDEGHGSIKDEDEQADQIQEGDDDNELNEEANTETQDKDPSPSESVSPVVVGGDADELEALTKKEISLGEGEGILGESHGSDGNGYHGDMDEPNSLATSYQGSLGLSSDAGLGTTAELSFLKDELEDQVKQEEIDKLDEMSQKETAENGVENEVGEVSATGSDNVIDPEDELEDQVKQEEIDKVDEVSQNETVENGVEDEVGEVWATGSENVMDPELETEPQDEKSEVQEDSEQSVALIEDSVIEDVTQSEERSPSSMNEDTGDSGRGDGEENESEVKAATPENSDTKEEINDGKEEIEITGEVTGRGSVELDEAVNVGSENEDESERPNTSDVEAKTGENEPESNANVDDNKQDQSVEEEENVDDNKQDQSAEEEEIKEVPALARIPGTHKSINQKKMHRKKELDATSTPRTNTNKVNRKPISWRSGPIQPLNQPEIAKTRNTKPQHRPFRARKISDSSERSQGKPGEKEDDSEKKEQIEENEEDNSQNSQNDHTSDAFDLPTVSVLPEGEMSVPLSLDTFRSEGHFPQDDSQTEEEEDQKQEDESQGMSKSESMPEIRYNDITRPSTAGKRDKRRRQKRFKNVKPRISSTWGKNPPIGWASHRSSVSQGGNKTTSEVWVPEEDKLYVYTYSSQPRLLHVRRMGAGRSVATSQDPNSPFRLKTRGNGNPMYDRRVVRGSNFSKRLGNDDPPKWNPYFSNARSLQQSEASEGGGGGPVPTNNPNSHQLNQRRQEFREKLEARARLRRENHGLSSLYPSHGAHHQTHRSHARTHAHVQTENYYEPLERPPAADTGVQTDVDWGVSEGGSAPPTLYQPPRGVEASTQVFERELSGRGDGEEGVIAVLVATTVREAVLEVAEEEEHEQQHITRRRQQMVGGGVVDQPSVTNASHDDGRADNKGEEGGEEEDENKSQAEEEEERREPEGKETTPADTQEPARSPEPGQGVDPGSLSGPELKGVHLFSALEVPAEHAARESVQESESLAA